MKSKFAGEGFEDAHAQGTSIAVCGFGECFWINVFSSPVMVNKGIFLLRYIHNEHKMCTNAKMKIINQ